MKVDARTVRGQKKEEIGKDRLHGYAVMCFSTKLRLLFLTCPVVFSVVSHQFFHCCVVPCCFGVLDIIVRVRCNPQPDDQTIIHILFCLYNSTIT